MLKLKCTFCENLR
uniref:Uncharacterized protein n=1 Tax=Rhizophora mucronata TaxID=61149 RepID=A0A2P2KCX3_RHIMU